MRTRTPLAVLALLAAGTLLTGCGDETSQSEATSPEDVQGQRGQVLSDSDAEVEDSFQDGGVSGSTGDPVTVVRAALTALAEGDGATACGYFAPDFAAEFVVEAAENDRPVATCAEAIDQAGPSEYYSDEIATAVVTDDYGNEQWVTVVWDSNPTELVWTLELGTDGNWYVDNDLS